MTDWRKMSAMSAMSAMGLMALAHAAWAQEGAAQKVRVLSAEQFVVPSAESSAEPRQSPSPSTEPIQETSKEAIKEQGMRQEIVFTSSVKASDQQRQQRVGDYIIAIVNNEPITRQELRARLYRIELQMLQAGAILPDRQELEKELLQKMIDDRVQVQYGREVGLRVDESAVSQSLQNMASQNGIDETQFVEKLRADGVSIAQLRKDLRDELLLDKVREAQVQGINISETELNDHIDQQKKAAEDPKQTLINLAQVLVAIPENASASEIALLEEKAQKIARRAKKESFASLIALSDGQRLEGGAMGLRSIQEYPDIFVLTADQMPVGAVSEPIRSPAGFHILKLLERSRPKLDDSVVQTQVRHIILRLDETRTEKMAIELLKQVKASIVQNQKTFAQAALEYSQDGSANTGGMLGWTDPGQFVPEFEEVMNRMPIGQISDPIITRYGVHLMEITQRRRLRVDELKQRDLIRKSLKLQKGAEAMRHWSEELRARAYVELRSAP